nr:hypothetical protein BaRGS_009671 [Batillaria attramentaria]
MPADGSEPLSLLLGLRDRDTDSDDRHRLVTCSDGQWADLTVIVNGTCSTAVTQIRGLIYSLDLVLVPTSEVVLTATDMEHIENNTGDIAPLVVLKFGDEEAALTELELAWLEENELRVTLLLASHRVTSGTGCTALGMVVHMAWLSMFCWTSVCSAHMFRVFSAKTYRGSGSGHYSKLVRNIIITILLPAVGVGLVVGVSYHTSDGASIGYSSIRCYLESALLVGVAMVLPVSIILVLNLLLFVLTVRRIHQVTKLKARSESERDSRQHVHVCARLSVLTGVTWVLSLIAEGADIDWLRAVAILTNGGQGVLLFLSYVATRRVAAMDLRMRNMEDNEGDAAKDPDFFFFNTCLRRIFNIRWPEEIRNEQLWERAGQEPVTKQILRKKRHVLLPQAQLHGQHGGHATGGDVRQEEKDALSPISQNGNSLQPSDAPCLGYDGQDPSGASEDREARADV